MDAAAVRMIAVHTSCTHLLCSVRHDAARGLLLATGPGRAEAKVVGSLAREPPQANPRLAGRCCVSGLCGCRLYTAVPPWPPANCVRARGCGWGGREGSRRHTIGRNAGRCTSLARLNLVGAAPSAPEAGAAPWAAVCTCSLAEAGCSGTLHKPAQHKPAACARGSHPPLGRPTSLRVNTNCTSGGCVCRAHSCGLAAVGVFCAGQRQKAAAARSTGTHALGSDAWAGNRRTLAAAGVPGNCCLGCCHRRPVCCLSVPCPRPSHPSL